MANGRLKALQGRLKGPLLIKKNENLFYLTGRSFDYRADEYLLVTKRDVVAFGSGLENIEWAKKSDRLKNIGQYIKAKKLDIEWGFSYGEGGYLKRKIKDLGLNVKVEPSTSAVDEMRQVKDAAELSKIGKSMQIVERVFKLVRKEIKQPGMTEVRLAQFIQNKGLRMGAEDVSFPAIVASGANAAIPHHVPTSKKLKAGESIIIDFGFKYKNYCSDFTRTLFLKSVPQKLARAYNQTEKAYNESMEFINSPRPPLWKRGGGKQAAPPLSLKRRRGEVYAGDVYQRAVDVLAETKLDKYFIHSLGHGTGLEIHELPNLSPGSKDVMEDNMVFSIEPGVYFRGIGGVRIEDLVYLKEGKCKTFIRIPTDLESNIIA